VLEVEFSELVRAVSLSAGVSLGRASGMLRFSPAVKTRRQYDPYKTFARLNHNYKRDLIVGRKRPRRFATLLDRSAEVVRNLLANASEDGVELATLVRELTAQFGCPDKTAYQYISRMEFVEKFADPITGARMCRIAAVSLPAAETDRGSTLPIENAPTWVISASA
jgi:hypothetical protein